MNAEKIIPYGRQWIDEDDIQAVVSVLRSDRLTQGPAVKAFEDSLCGYCGARYAVAFSSGTAALHGAYYAAGLSAVDEFITSPMTFAATSNAGLYLGAVPKFCAIEPDTGNINASKIEKLIDKKVKMIVPVHYSGLPADMKEIKRTADRHGLVVIEDACHALGSVYDGVKTGACEYSDMCVFSFHPVKHVATGEGGAVLTNSREFYEKLNSFRSHGMVKKNFINEPHGGWYMEMQELGCNYRITDIQCALGASQMKKLDRSVERRTEIAQMYDKTFEGDERISVPPRRKDRLNAYHLYPVRLRQERKRVYDRLIEEGIYAQVHYLPVYMHPYYRRNGFEGFSEPSAEAFYTQELSIPMYPAMSDDDVMYIIDKLKTILSEIR